MRGAAAQGLVRRLPFVICGVSLHAVRRMRREGIHPFRRKAAWAGRTSERICAFPAEKFHPGRNGLRTIVRRFCPAPHLHRLEAAEQEVQKVRYSRGERTACRRGMQMLAAGLCVLCLAGSLCAVLRASAEQAYRFPLKTAAWRVSDGYGERTDPFTGQAAFHAGVDLACAEGTAVQAAQNGVVTRAKHSASYGNVLYIQQADGLEARYAHLQYLYVRTGEVVAAGQLLGTAGQTGRATGAHLHFELRERGLPCDPSAALGLPDA